MKSAPPEPMPVPKMLFGDLSKTRRIAYRGRYKDIAMDAQRVVCPKSMRACPAPGTCPGCLVHAALQRRESGELRKELMVLWEGEPLRATSWQELMRCLGLSESDAREMECQEQCLVDREIARFPKSIQ